jgi:hypothetical protein
MHSTIQLRRCSAIKHTIKHHIAQVFRLVSVVLCAHSHYISPILRYATHLYLLLAIHDIDSISPSTIYPVEVDFVEQNRY